MNLEAGKFLCLQGDSCQSFYIVKKGLLIASYKDEQNKVQTQNFGPGSTFGEFSLVEGEPAEYTIRAAEDSEIEAIPQSDFQEIMAQQPIWMKSIVSFLTKRHHIAKENKHKRDIITTFPSLLFILTRQKNEQVQLESIQKELANFSRLSSLGAYKLLLILQDFKLVRLHSTSVTIENEQLLRILYETIRHRAIYKSSSPNILSLTDQAILTSFVNVARDKGEMQPDGLIAVKTSDLTAQIKHSMHGMSLTMRTLETLLQKRLLQTNPAIDDQNRNQAELESIQSFSANFDKLLNLLELNRIYPQLDKKLVVG